jgi:small-conductance mechanosensitive channel
VIGQALYYNVRPMRIFDGHLPAPAAGSLGRPRIQAASLAGIILNTSLGIRTFLAIEAMVLSRSGHAAQDIYRQRRVATCIQMLRRLLVVVIVALGVGALLMTFQPVRQLGTGLLASAGVAGVIAGFAAQKSLGMIIGGLQLAITEPIRLNDEIIIEGEWGVIEEITLTYAVVRTWDQRSLVVPITYFLEKSFRNWTRATARGSRAHRSHVRTVGWPGVRVPGHRF